MTMSLRMKIQNPYATTIRLGAGPPPPRPRASSVGTAVGTVSIVAIVMRAASGPDRRPPGALHVPERVDRLDSGQHCIVVGGWRRGGRPLQGAAVPRVAGQVEALLPRADADIELRDLAEYSGENDDGP